MKKLILGVLCIALAGIQGFGGGQKAAPASGTKRVANVVAEYNEWNHIFFAGLKEAADEYGWEIETFDAAQDVNQQINMVNSAAAQGFDFLLIQPVNNAALAPALERASDAGVIVISAYDYDANDPISKKIYQVLFGQKESGVLEAETYVKLAGDTGKVALIGGLTGADNARRRSEGMREVLAKYPGITIVQEVFCDWDRQKAMAAAEDIITAHPDLKAFIVQDDQMSWGVYAAIEAAGKAGQIKIASQGFYESSIPAIKEDKFMFTITYPPKFAARDMMQTFKAVSDGKQVDRIQYYGMELVTKENVDVAPF
ncbi:MAG: sugar ABC transporter substrate-binding protein [Treponema sp.]|jgi:ribose transport system substrate-binding protein|nr:sugar ABC transporter substrate-binding protein [Treponema sp.]